MSLVSSIWLFLRAVFLPRALIAAENLGLRQQLGALRRSAKRPRLRQVDRVFWVWLSRLWADWQSSLVIVKPEAVASHRHRLGERSSITTSVTSPRSTSSWSQRSVSACSTVSWCFATSVGESSTST